MLIDFNTIKIDWTAISAVGTCLGSFATFCAVIVALWQTKHQFKKSLFIKNNFTCLGDIQMLCFGLDICNNGNRNINIQNVGLLINKSTKINIPLFPFDSQRNKINLPIVLEPDNSLQMLFELKQIKKSLEETKQANLIIDNDKIKFYVEDDFSSIYFFNKKITVKEFLNKFENNITGDNE